MGCLKSKEKDPDPAPMKEPEAKTVDPRLPFETYRQLFNMKNSWKVINRGLETNAKLNLTKLLETHPEYRKLFKEVGDKELDSLQKDENFELSATDLYMIIDDVMENSEKVDFALMQLQTHAATYKEKGFPIEFFKDMEASFLWNASELLGDRYSDATDKNFRLLYSFVYKKMCEGYGVPVDDGNTSNRI